MCFKLKLESKANNELNLGESQPRSQGLSSYCPLGRVRIDPGNEFGRVYESLTQNKLVDCSFWYQLQLWLDKTPLDLLNVILIFINSELKQKLYHMKE